MAIIDRRYGGYKTTYKHGKFCYYNRPCYSDIRIEQINLIKCPVVFALPKKKKGSHYTFLSKEDVLKYLTEVFKLTNIPFIAFSESDEWYWAHTIFPNNKRYKLFVSTIVRYAFEDHFAVFTYFAMKNEKLQKEMDIIHLVQLYISHFGYCDNHSLFYNGYTFYGNEDVKDWYKEHELYFTDKYSYQITTANYGIQNMYINEKCLDTLAYSINNKINNLYEKHKENLCCRRS